MRLKEKANYAFKTFDRFMFFKILQIFFEVADRQKQSLLLYCLNKTKVTNSDTGQKIDSFCMCPCIQEFVHSYKNIAIPALYGDIRGPFHLFWELDVSLCLALQFHTFRVSWLSVRPFVFLIFGLHILTVFYTMFVHPTLPSVVFPSGHPLQFITQNI